MNGVVVGCEEKNGFGVDVDDGLGRCAKNGFRV